MTVGMKARALEHEVFYGILQDDLIPSMFLHHYRPGGRAVGTGVSGRNVGLSSPFQGTG